MHLKIKFIINSQVPSILIVNFSVSVIKHNDQGNLWKELFIWAYHFKTQKLECRHDSGEKVVDRVPEAEAKGSHLEP